MFHVHTMMTFVGKPIIYIFIIKDISDSSMSFQEIKGDKLYYFYIPLFADSTISSFMPPVNKAIESLIHKKIASNRTQYDSMS